MKLKVTLMVLAIIDVVMVVLLILTLTSVVCDGLVCLVWFWIIIPLLVVFDILTIVVGYRFSKYKKAHQLTEPEEMIHQEI